MTLLPQEQSTLPADLSLIAEGQGEPVNLRELVELCAVDSVLFAETFFPKTMRMKSPPFAKKVWNKLDSTSRLVSLQLFRGASKTSICRVFGAKKIAYAQARTILWIGKSQDKAIHSVKWLRKQVEFNRLYANTFGLRPGSKWQDIECEIYHGIEETPITILAYGITGPVRGLNIDDYRPDLILLDDIIDEEIAASPLQRENIERLVYGALKESLAPASEAPDAKMVMLQTPIESEDISMKSLSDPEWDAIRVPCWTIETENLPLNERESAWPERFPSEVLRREKELAAARNQLSIFSREKECRITSRETSTFLPEWLKFYDLDPPHTATTIMVIDPVPPPSEAEIKKGFKDKDYEVISVVSRIGGNFYLREYSANRGHDPSWTIAEFFRLAIKYNPREVIVESIAYQRTLAWLLKKAMENQRRYFVINEMTDKRKKFQRIVDGLSGPAANGKLYIKRTHSEFIQQFTAFPNVAHDDVIETVAIACQKLSGAGSEGAAESWNDILAEEKSLKKLEYYGGAP